MMDKEGFVRETLKGTLMGLLGLFQKWVGLVKEPFVIYYAVQDPRVSTRSRVAAIVSAILLVLYVINPLDLIPELVPFGFIDDLIIIPLATYLIERILPRPVVRESRVMANARLRPFNLALNIIAAAILIFVIGVIIAVVVLVILVIQRLRPEATPAGMSSLLLFISTNKRSFL